MPKHKRRYKLAPRHQPPPPRLSYVRSVTTTIGGVEVMVLHAEEPEDQPYLLKIYQTILSHGLELAEPSHILLQVLSGNVTRLTIVPVVGVGTAQ